jgi:hypothetical protein
MREEDERGGGMEDGRGWEAVRPCARSSLVTGDIMKRSAYEKAHDAF